MEMGRASVEIINGVGTVTFSHPRGNSLPGSLLREIAGHIEMLGQEESVGVVLLRSEGEKAFCAGASFDELKSLKNHEQGKEFFLGFARVILAIRNCPRLVLARVQGKAVGGGVGIIAAADYVIAAQDASIRLSEFALGFGPFVIGEAVRRKLGNSGFSHLAVSAAWQSAQWAFERGLYNEVFLSLPELDARVEDFSRQIAVTNKDAQREMKIMLWQGTDQWEKVLEERAGVTTKLALGGYAQKVLSGL